MRSCENGSDMQSQHTMLLFTPQQLAPYLHNLTDNMPAPRILIFSIAMGADYLFYVKSIATYAPAFLGYNNSVFASVQEALNN